MQSIIVIACLGLLLCIEPATAQQVPPLKVYPLKVRFHKDVQPPLTERAVERILRRASGLLQVRNTCSVKFELATPDGLKRFASPDTPKIISNEDQLEAVHREVGDVKVVEKITFCRKQADANEDFKGCGWRREGTPTVIVTQKLLALRYILWAHEFGHTTGLPHRADQGALMTPCKLFFGNVNINRYECDCFRKGPGGCPMPQPHQEIACAESQR